MYTRTARRDGDPVRFLPSKPRGELSSHQVQALGFHDDAAENAVDSYNLFPLMNQASSRNDMDIFNEIAVHFFLIVRLSRPIWNPVSSQNQ